MHNGLKFKHYPERDISKGYLSAARSQGDLILIEDPFVSRFNTPLDNRRDFFHRYTVQSSEIRHLTVWVRRFLGAAGSFALPRGQLLSPPECFRACFFRARSKIKGLRAARGGTQTYRRRKALDCADSIEAMFWIPSLCLAERNSNRHNHDGDRENRCEQPASLIDTLVHEFLPYTCSEQLSRGSGVPDGGTGQTIEFQSRT